MLEAGPQEIVSPLAAFQQEQAIDQLLLHQEADQFLQPLGCGLRLLAIKLILNGPFSISLDQGWVELPLLGVMLFLDEVVVGLKTDCGQQVDMVSQSPDGVMQGLCFFAV